MVLYVDEQGAEIHVTGERVIISKDDEPLQTLRLRDIERIVLIGPIDFTTPAMQAVLDAGIETHFLSIAGAYRGRLVPGEGKNVLLRRAQFRRADDAAFRTELARIIVAAKITNCRYIIQRYTRNHPSDTLDAAEQDLAELGQRVGAMPDVGACMGVEGAAGRVYFAALGSMVRREFAFTERTRRPPRDPVNALLSFGYALLVGEVAGALEAQGLDACCGFVHSIEYGRPALALDVLEEFRPLVADRIALSLVNNGVLGSEHFQTEDEGGVLLNDKGRETYLKTYHRTMSREVAARDGSGHVSFRLLLRTQAASMRAAVEGRGAYDPYTPR